MIIIPNNASFALWMVFALCAIPSLSSHAAQDTFRDEPILPLPLTVNLDADKIQLGETLFNDTRLSLNNKIACATCHQLASGGDDNRAIGIAHSKTGQKSNNHVINTPTIFNVRYNFRQNWDGSAKTLRDSIDKVVNNHLEANTNWIELLTELRQDDNLSRQFSDIYHDGLNQTSYINALSEYIKSLVTPNSRFDQYLSGNDSAISSNEKKGYQLFKDLGCTSCHQGINIGGNLFQKLGIFYDYFGARGNITNADYGRMNVTGRQTDKYVFKVPSLRNIEVTAPYLHDGSAETLKDAVVIMGRTQLGREINSKETGLIIQFLKTLTGEYNNVMLKEGAS